MNCSIEEIVRRKSSDIPSQIRAPYTYISGLPTNNENMRFQFLIAFNEAFFHIKDESLLKAIGLVISVFHESSLLIDDIEDSSTTRRGQPCAHVLYGVPLTINTGNLMYFVALQKATSDLPRMVAETEAERETLLFKIHKILIDEMLNLHHGQGLDIYWRDILLSDWIEGKCELPSYDEYLSMVMDKTGGLFRLSVKLLGLFSHAISEDEVDDLIPLANILGIIYQVRDDFMNLLDDRYSVMKGILGEDLTEGKLSLPVLHALNDLGRESTSPLHSILFGIKLINERQAHPQLITDAITFMRKNTESLQFTQKLLTSFFDKCKATLQENKLEDSSMLARVVEKLLEIPPVL